MSSGIINASESFPLVKTTVPFKAPRNRGQLSCRVFTSFEEVDLERGDWDAAVAALGGSVYMTYDWARLWWKFYGQGRALRIMIFRGEGEIVAILPLYIDRVGVGPLKVKVGRLVGSNLPPKVFNPPVSAEWAAEVFGQVLTTFMNQEGCGLFSLGPVSQSYAPGVALETAGRAIPGLTATASREGVHCDWELPATLEEFYAGLSRNERKNRKADLKKLEVEHKATIRGSADGSSPEALFEAFMAQHAAQWAAEGRSGHFGAWPDGAEYNRELVKAHGALGRVRIIRIANDEETIGSLYAFAFGNCYYGELPARSTDPRFDKLSLGPAMIVGTIATAISEGITRMEGGLGQYEYKLRLNAREEPVSTYRVMSQSVAKRCALLGIRGCKASINPIYQKVWRKMIAPKILPGAAQRQSRWWIGLDF